MSWKDKLQRVPVRKICMLMLAGLVLSIVFQVMLPGTIVGEVKDSQVVHRYGLFGPSVERVELVDGSVMYTTNYPWYYFWEQSEGHRSMNIYGIAGSASSNQVYITCNYGDDPIPVTFKQQNDLDFSSSTNWFWSGKEDCVKSRLVAYNGLVTDTNADLDTLTDAYHTKEEQSGNWAYGETWTTTLYFTPDFLHGISGPGSYDYTVEETLYPSSLVGYDQDRAWVHLAVLEDPVISQEIGKGSITVSALDNLVQRPATVRMYKDGSLYQSSIYLKDGQRVFDNLEFGTYRFEVIDADFDTWCYDAFPQQSGYDYNVGEVELSASANAINYLICGDFASTTDNGFDSGTTLDYSNNTISEIIDSITDSSRGDTGEEPNYIAALVAILATLGLLAVVILGLPLFIIIVIVLLVFGVLFGDKKKGKRNGGNRK